MAGVIFHLKEEGRILTGIDICILGGVLRAASRIMLKLESLGGFKV